MASAGRWGTVAVVAWALLVPLSDVARGQGAAQPASGADKAAPKRPVKRAAKPQDDAAAAAEKQARIREEAVKAMEAGLAAQTAGKHDEAVKAFTRAASAGGLPPADLAKALYRRGGSNKALGKSSSAIADLTQALYLKGLSDAERSEALQARAQAYQDAGMSELAEADLKAAKRGGSGQTRSAAATGDAEKPAAAASTSWFGGLFGGSGSQTAAAKPDGDAEKPRPPTAERPAAASSAPVPAAGTAHKTAAPAGAAKPSSPVIATGWETRVARGPGREVTTASVRGSEAAAASVSSASPPKDTDAPVSTSGGVGSWFGGLFGGSGSATAPAQSTSSDETRPAAAGSQTSASEPVRTAQAAGGAATRATAKPAEATASKPAAPAGVKLEVASVRSEDQAKTLAQQLKASYAKLLEGREATIEKSDGGGSGPLYHVRIGPFADAKTGQRECPKIRISGLDCKVVKP